MARYSYIPNRVIDTNGIADGALIHAYQTGTTTPISLYSDDGLTVPVSNPYQVVAGAAVPQLYFSGPPTGARVKVVSSDGSTISDDDPYNPPMNATDLSAPSGGEMVGLDDDASGAKWTNAQEYTAYLRSSAGSSAMGFIPPSITASIRSVQDKLREMPSIMDYGGYNDGAVHTVADWIAAGTYADLAAVQVDYSFVTATTNCANWAAMTKLIAVAQAQGIGYAKLGFGVFVFTQTVALSGTPLTIVGLDSANITTGGRAGCTWRWEGAASPMITVASVGWIFHGFGVENGTTATTFTRCNVGAQRIWWSKVFGVFPNGTTRLGFSECFIHSEGDRLGYGGMIECIVNSVAPKIVDIQNAGTGNAITTFALIRNQFAASTQDMTVISNTGESIEVIAMTSNTFIMDGFECVVLDTTDTPAAETVYALIVEGNEFDVDSSAAMTATWRFFRLQNVRNGSFRNNQWYGGGTLTGLVQLISSNVTGNDGNYYYGLNGYLYDPDTASTVQPGRNVRNTANTEGDYLRTWTGNIGQPTFGAQPLLNPSAIPGPFKSFYVDITSNIAFQIRCNTTKPSWHGVGDKIRVWVRNVSGGAVTSTNGTFWSAQFNVTAAQTCPANGQQRFYDFEFNGTKWIETARSAADIAIA